MKTVRHNTFETNSSSTHSITILNKKDFSQKSLLIDNVLHPENLKFTPAYSRNETGYGRSSTLTAETRDQKAALFINHMISFLRESHYDLPDWINGKTEEALKHITESLMLHNGYSSINTDFTPVFDHYYDGDCYIDDFHDCSDFENFIMKIDEHISGIINNDDTIIKDSFSEY